MKRAISLALLVSTTAWAQGPAEFYKGRTVELYIGYSVGGGYDIYARLLARHMARHIPGNPVIAPKNMPGAGSLTLANWLYAAAPRDGSVFGTIGRGIAFDPLLGTQGTKFTATELGWLGSANDEVSVCAAWGKSGITKFEDLYARPVFIGGTGAGADTDLFPKVMNNILGTKMKLVTGYPGGNDITLAMQRGEVEARCGWSWSSIKSNHPQWVKDGTIRLLVQLSLEKHADLPQVPLIMDMVKTPEQRAVLRLVFARQALGAVRKEKRQEVLVGRMRARGVRRARAVVGECLLVVRFDAIAHPFRKFLRVRLRLSTASRPVAQVVRHVAGADHQHVVFLEP